MSFEVFRVPNPQLPISRITGQVRSRRLPGVYERRREDLDSDNIDSWSENYVSASLVAPIAMWT